LLFGAAIVIVGSLFLLDNLGILDAGDFWDYWPVAVILLGLVNLSSAQGATGRFGGFVLTLLGVLWLLDSLRYIDFRVWDYWPVVLIVIGGGIVWRTLAPAAWRGQASSACCCGAQDGASASSAKQPSSASDRAERLSAMAFLGGYSKNLATSDFRGADLTAVMGGCEVDLRGCSIAGDEADVNIVALWGGVDLKVPDDWNVELRVVPILGGCEDKTKAPIEGASKRLIVNGVAIMGGIGIRN
jgi:predicted membrane protein